MSHLNTKQDNELFFERHEYDRLHRSLISGWVITVVALILVGYTNLASVEGSMFIVNLVAGFILMFCGVSLITANHAPVARRREIRDLLGGIVDELNGTRGRLRNRYYRFGEEDGYHVTALCYYSGAWHLEVFDSDSDGQPIFRVLVTKSCASDPDSPDSPLGYMAGSLYQLKDLNKIISGSWVYPLEGEDRLLDETGEGNETTVEFDETLTATESQS